MASLLQLQNAQFLGEVLGLKPLPPEQSGGHILVGGPIKYEITEDTVKAIKALIGNLVAVEADGRLVKN